jgi:DNA-binding NtrC family response regulator
MIHVLVGALERSILEDLGRCLPKEYKMDLARDRAACLELFRRRRHEYTFLDVQMLREGLAADARANYKELLQPLWQAFPAAHIIAISPPVLIREAVAAVKAGASSYLTYPFDPVEVAYVLESLWDFQLMEEELLHLRQRDLLNVAHEGTRTRSRKMKDLLERIRGVAPTKTTVLLTGETGVGKGVMARLLHAWSHRAEGPYVAVHCGAVPETLLESEFFGHEKGAFTGAFRRKLGKFQIADNGTLFLDEIGTIPPAAQVKLLQVIQDRSFTRLGGEELIDVDIRLVAASNLDLKELCREGRFREDLYYRLNVFPIEVPPLRERAEDIPLLVDTFLERLNRTNTKDIRAVSDEVMEVLPRYAWPGNVRELENLIERAYILEAGAVLGPESFPAELFALDAVSEFRPSDEIPSLEDVRRTAIEQVERKYLREILAMKRGRVDQTAAVAGITPRQLHNLMARYGLRKEEFK